jgi:hypothetical protein
VCVLLICCLTQPNRLQEQLVQVTRCMWCWWQSLQSCMLTTVLSSAAVLVRYVCCCVLVVCAGATSAMRWDTWQGTAA